MIDREIKPDEHMGSASRPLRSDDDGDLDVIELLISLAKRKYLLLGLPLAAGALAAAVSLFLPNVYTASARILPPQQSQSNAAALLGQLGGLGNVAAGLPSARNPADVYVAILRSRSVADPLIEQFKLGQLFSSRTADDARAALAEISRISSGKDGIITVEVDDVDAQRAANLANAYVEQLERMTGRLAVTEASQRRLFFETQLRHQKEALAAAEIELKKTQQQTGLIKLDEQGKAIIDAVAQVRAQIAAKEVQIQAMRSFSADRNPELFRAEAELGALQQQLRKMERSNALAQDSTFVPAGRVPELGLQYVRRFRDVKYQETLFELLARQYELARLDESKDASIIQVLDAAVPPERKSKPRRALIVLFTAMAALAVAAVVALLQEAYERARSDPARADRLAMLKAYLRLRLPRPPIGRS